MKTSFENQGCAACAAVEAPPQASQARAQRKEAAQEWLGYLLVLVLAVAGYLLYSGRLEAVLSDSATTLGSWTTIVGFLLLATALGLAGGPVFLAAGRNLLRGRVFDEMFLMSIASLGAFAIGAMEEAVGVMLFYRVGEFFQERAARRSRQSIHSLLSLSPDTANRLDAGGITEVDPAELRPGDRILVRPGERLPVDGLVLEGQSGLDTRSLTGEALPRPAGPGDQVLAGFIALDGSLTIECQKPASESSASKILELVQNASAAKARTELFISRFARWYTPLVVGMAILLAVLPPSIGRLYGLGWTYSQWLYRALVLLVMSCPCALVLSVPLSYFAGLGGAARRGILIKGARIFDALADAKTVVFDKTGTLSDGSFRVVDLRPEVGLEPDELLRLAASAGSHSSHPLALAVRAACAERGLAFQEAEAASYRELPGQGSIASQDGHRLLAGNQGLMAAHGIAIPSGSSQASLIHLAMDGGYLGSIHVADQAKADSATTVTRLRRLGVHRIVLLTGDTEEAAARLSQDCGIDEYHAGLLPGDKLTRLEAIIAEVAGRGSVLFAGDGTNDAPVLARADAGLAIGGNATDAAIETADVVLPSGRPSKVAEAIEAARFTRAIVTQNIVFALAVKAVFMAFGGFGLAGMWEAVIADVGVALLAVLNATRALRQERPTPKR